MRPGTGPDVRPGPRGLCKLAVPPALTMANSASDPSRLPRRLLKAPVLGVNVDLRGYLSVLPSTRSRQVPRAGFVTIPAVAYWFYRGVIINSSDQWFSNGRYTLQPEHSAWVSLRTGGLWGGWATSSLTMSSGVGLQPLRGRHGRPAFRSGSIAPCVSPHGRT